MTDTYYAALLAKNPETQAGILYLPSHFSYHQNKWVIRFIWKYLTPLPASRVICHLFKKLNEHIVNVGLSIYILMDVIE